MVLTPHIILQIDFLSPYCLKCVLVNIFHTDDFIWKLHSERCYECAETTFSFVGHMSCFSFSITNDTAIFHGVCVCVCACGTCVWTQTLIHVQYAFYLWVIASAWSFLYVTLCTYVWRLFSSLIEQQQQQQQQHGFYESNGRPVFIPQLSGRFFFPSWDGVLLNRLKCVILTFHPPEQLELQICTSAHSCQIIF